MPPAPTVLLLRLFRGYLHDSALFYSSGPWGGSQQPQDFHRGVAAQVLPRLLPRVVPQRHVSVERADQEPDHVLVAVDGGDVERGVAAR